MVHVFLLMGQSNMAGRGFLKDVEPIVDDRIKMLRNGRWVRMWEPIHTDRSFAGIGPAASFAKMWLEDHPDEEIGLVACAEGGSALAEWMPGEALFEHAVSEAGFAARIGVIDGILWHQGESDTGSDEVPLFLDKLTLIRREFCQRTGLNEVPFLIGKLGSYLAGCQIIPEYQNYAAINEKLAIYAENQANTYLITADGLTPNPDIIHFDAVSQRLFGLRYYAAYKERKDITEPLAMEAEYAQEFIKK